MVDWPKVKLRNLAATKKWALNGGPFGSKLVSKDYVQHGVPVIRGGNLPDGAKFSFDDLVFVSEQKADSLLPNNAHPGDIVFTQRGTLGQVGIIPEHGIYSRYVISQSQMKLTVDRTKAVAEFIYYFFRSPATVESIKSHSLVAGVPHINLDILRNWEVPLPPLAVQRRIAAILSAYDDLIENNTRRIQILERMAQALYREWCVHFRFPGHAKVQRVASPLGPIPQGWEVNRIGDVIETLGGGTPSTKVSAYWDDGTINWYAPSDLTAANALFVTESSRKITDLGLQESNAKLFPANCVMMTSRATIGVIAINTTPATTNQGFIICIPTAQLCAYHIVEWIKQNLKLITNVASGATFKEISRSEFRDLQIVLPPEPIERKYEVAVDPIYQNIRVLLAKNATLRRTRDLLLPRLISGALDVSQLDLATDLERGIYSAASLPNNPDVTE